MSGLPVFINGRFLEQRVTGVQRFAIEVLSALDGLLADEVGAQPRRVVVLAPRGARSLPLQRIPIHQLGSSHGHTWEQLTLPAATGAAPLLSFGPTGPLAKRNQVVTIHDAAIRAVPEAYGRRFRAWYGALLPLLVRRSRVLMTVSEFSKGELLRYFAARPEQVRVTGEGWQHILRTPADARVVEKHGLRPRGYLLAVGTHTPNKNFGVIARALARVNDPAIQVAVVGAVDGRLFADALVPHRASMRMLGYVTDGELRTLYANAVAFVFPSFYEGFGLPPLEAMAMDCPVLSSNAASLPEVCGDAALYFDPADDAALARLIRRVTSADFERDRLVDRGRERLRHFSWRGAALAYLSLLREWPGVDLLAPRSRREPVMGRTQRREDTTSNSK